MLMKSQYHCTKCNYKFAKDKEPAKCPYCGAVGTIEREQSAQELLDDLSGMDEDLQDTRNEMKKYK